MRQQQVNAVLAPKEAKLQHLQESKLPSAASQITLLESQMSGPRKIRDDLNVKLAPLAALDVMVAADIQYLKTLDAGIATATASNSQLVVAIATTNSTLAATRQQRTDTNANIHAFQNQHDQWEAALAQIAADTEAQNAKIDQLAISQVAAAQAVEDDRKVLTIVAQTVAAWTLEQQWWREAPIALTPENGLLYEGKAVRFTLSVPDNPFDASFRFGFALQPSDLAGSFAAAGTARSASFNFPTGTFTVYGRILGKNGNIKDVATTVTITNVAPTVSITGVPDSSPEGTAVTPMPNVPAIVSSPSTFSAASLTKALAIPKGFTAAVAPEEGMYIADIIMSSDGKTFFLSSFQNGYCTIKQIDSLTGQVKLTLDASAGVFAHMRLSADGSTLLTGDFNRQMKEWDLTGVSPVLRQTFGPFANTIIDIDLSPNGTYALAAAAGQSGVILNLKTGKQTLVPGNVNRVEFGPGGEVAYISDGASVHGYEPSTGALKINLAPLAAMVCTLAPSPSGDWIAMGSNKGEVALRRADGGSVLLVTNATGTYAESLAWTDASHLIVGRVNGVIETYDVTSTSVTLQSTYTVPDVPSAMIVRGTEFVVVAGPGIYVQKLPVGMGSSSLQPASSTPPVPAIAATPAAVILASAGSAANAPNANEATPRTVVDVIFPSFRLQKSGTDSITVTYQGMPEGVAIALTDSDRTEIRLGSSIPLTGGSGSITVNIFSRLPSKLSDYTFVRVMIEISADHSLRNPQEFGNMVCTITRDHQIWLDSKMKFPPALVYERARTIPAASLLHKQFETLSTDLQTTAEELQEFYGFSAPDGKFGVNQQGREEWDLFSASQDSSFTLEKDGTLMGHGKVLAQLSTAFFATPELLLESSVGKAGISKMIVLPEIAQFIPTPALTAYAAKVSSLGLSVKGNSFNEAGVEEEYLWSSGGWVVSLSNGDLVSESEFLAWRLDHAKPLTPIASFPTAFSRKLDVLVALPERLRDIDLLKELSPAARNALPALCNGAFDLDRATDGVVLAIDPKTARSWRWDTDAQLWRLQPKEIKNQVLITEPVVTTWVLDYVFRDSFSSVIESTVSQLVPNWMPSMWELEKQANPDDFGRAPGDDMGQAWREAYLGTGDPRQRNSDYEGKLRQQSDLRLRMEQYVSRDYETLIRPTLIALYLQWEKWMAGEPTDANWKPAGPSYVNWNAVNEAIDVVFGRLYAVRKDLHQQYLNRMQIKEEQSVTAGTAARIAANQTISQLAFDHNARVIMEANAVNPTLAIQMITAYGYANGHSTTPEELVAITGRSRSEVTDGLLGLIPSGQDVPAIGNDPKAREWVAYLERTTTDPAGLSFNFIVSESGAHRFVLTGISPWFIPGKTLITLESETGTLNVQFQQVGNLRRAEAPFLAPGTYRVRIASLVAPMQQNDPSSAGEVRLLVWRVVGGESHNPTSGSYSGPEVALVYSERTSRLAALAYYYLPLLRQEVIDNSPLVKMAHVIPLDAPMDVATRDALFKSVPVDRVTPELVVKYAQLAGLGAAEPAVKEVLYPSFLRFFTEVQADGTDRALGNLLGKLKEIPNAKIKGTDLTQILLGIAFEAIDPGHPSLNFGQRSALEVGLASALVKLGGFTIERAIPIAGLALLAVDAGMVIHDLATLDRRWILPQYVLFNGKPAMLPAYSVTVLRDALATGNAGALGAMWYDASERLYNQMVDRRMITPAEADTQRQLLKEFFREVSRQMNKNIDPVPQHFLRQA